ncbi:hypothetical protein [Nonomuraea diastatica]|uniref:hypothetical protein n=1 Tax=Nonomuraea diastatica TaxID=1848329 RepID=UPI001407C2E1|nr:hypothetical protein [Nonomuraea diastatica]
MKRSSPLLSCQVKAKAWFKRKRRVIRMRWVIAFFAVAGIIVIDGDLNLITLVF